MEPANTSSGTYVLILDLGRPRRLYFGRGTGRRCVQVDRFVAYCGSAQGGRLQSRTRRHLGKVRRPHWHADWTSRKAVRKDVILRPGRPKSDECALRRAIAKIPGAHVVPGFGKGDCREGCGGHLVIVPATALGEVRRLASGDVK